MYLTYLPGHMIAELYEEHGLRMLERNVRAFLQIRGKVNQGIRRTLLNEPQRFLAFNNGISAVADAVTLVDMPGGGCAIAHIRNLQIVNGGQTSATLHHARYKDGANLDGVIVQTKLTVVPEAAVESVVPLISQYANSQNKVSDADFAANEAFHVRVEKLSRTTLAPAPAGGQETHWFYERVRGQYLYEQGRAGTPARKKRFRELYPATQRFSKTDIGKFINSWHRLPHVVSLGSAEEFHAVHGRREGGARVEQGGVTRFHPHRGPGHLVQAYRPDRPAHGPRRLQGEHRDLLHRLSRPCDGRAPRSRPDMEGPEGEPGDRAGHHHGGTGGEGVHNDAARRKNIGEWCKERKCWEALRSRTIDLGAIFRKSLVPAEIVLPETRPTNPPVPVVPPKILRVGKVSAK